MKKYSLTIFSIIIIIYSCKYHNPPERNKLVFKNEYRQVFDSLNNMLQMLPLIAIPEEIELNKNYLVKQGNALYVNDSLLSVNTSNSEFPADKKLRFLNNALFLKDNGIDGAYYSKMDGDWFFLYRYSVECAFDDLRIIIINSEEHFSTSYSTHQGLDHQDGIYLIAPKDAIIR